ncbi:MAG: DNA double-strand break repair nuclease NurA [Thermoplasmata archaeon]|nr:DNA double-strand break repair nuclease NurA [Thermoplasmata archaeon]
MSYVDDMRRELELLARHQRDLPLLPEEIPDFRVFRAADASRDMIAVDGSYSFLLNLSSWWLALISVGLLRYTFDGRSFRRKDWRLVQRMVGVSTLQEFVAMQDDLHRSLFEFTKERREEQPRDMVNEYRRLVEGQLAINFADEADGAIVAIDGTLSEFPKQFTFMERLVALCEKRGHVLVGISKDSQLHSFGHVLTDEDLMLRTQGRLPRDALAYARAPEASEAAKAGLLYGDIYYARLHPQARKWFRVDVGTFRDDPDFVFGQLAPYAKSLLSVGYPLPLIEAHRMAVTVRQLRPMYEETVLKAAVRMGLDVRTVLDGLTSVEGRRRSAFHEYLDRVARDLR